jgi:hypothetical protein
MGSSSSRRSLFASPGSPDTESITPAKPSLVQDRRGCWLQWIYVSRVGTYQRLRWIDHLSRRVAPARRREEELPVDLPADDRPARPLRARRHDHPSAGIPPIAVAVPLPSPVGPHEISRGRGTGGDHLDRRRPRCERHRHVVRGQDLDGRRAGHGGRPAGDRCRERDACARSDHGLAMVSRDARHGR